MTEQYHRSCMFLQAQAEGSLRQKTYVPPTYADVPSLWRRWLEEDTARSDAAASSPSRLGSLRGMGRPAAVSEEGSRLKELLALQAARAQEAEVYNKIQVHNQQLHIALLDRTPDISNGRLDPVLANTRALTALRE